MLSVGVVVVTGPWFQERRTHTQGLLNLIKTRDGDVRRLEVSFSAMKDANDALKEKVRTHYMK